MNTKEFFEALRVMESEKGIPAEFIAEKISTAIVTAVKKEYGGREIVFCDIDCEKQKFSVYVKKNVVEEIEDEYADILLEDALNHNKRSKLGGTLTIKLDTKQFGRIVAQTAKHVIRQGIRDVERGQTMAEFQSRNRELVTAVVQRVDPKTGNVSLTIGHGDAMLPKLEQVPGEELHEGDHIKVYIVDVRDGEKGMRVKLSRTHPGLVERLFENEVPEIYDGTIEIKAISRQAGSRTKMAVWSANSEIDAVGACIGPKGARVNSIVSELSGEKIDIVKYSDDPAEFISEALSPSKVVGVEILDAEAKTCRATVPDSQLSLAIGNGGQNVRLAVKLTGWNIDIRPESGFYGEDDAD